MRLVWSNEDKPHRCPRCHSVCFDVRARFRDIGRCELCNVCWVVAEAYVRIWAYKLRRRLKGYR